jgi:hypothetical protein
MYEQIIKRHRPRGYRVIYSKRKDKIAAEALEFYSRVPLPRKLPAPQVVALCDPEKRLIYAPHVVEEFTLQILLHEFGHVHLDHWGKGASVQHREEYEAERWAIEIMRMEGISVPRAAEARFRRYIRLCIKEDAAKGIVIQRHVARRVK